MTQIKTTRLTFSILVLICLLMAGDRQANISKEGIELIVFSWDNPMGARFPPIHVWKDNRAMWLDWEEVTSLQYHWHVYETILSNSEILSVEKLLSDSGYWYDLGQGFINPDSSELTIWVNFSHQEKSVVAYNSQYSSLITSLHKILENSTRKIEYYPEGAYLFEQGQSPQYVYIEGKALSIAWTAVKNGDYSYSLEIPGLSCVTSYDGVKYTCKMYSSSTP